MSSQPCGCDPEARHVCAEHEAADRFRAIRALAYRARTIGDDLTDPRNRDVETILNEIISLTR